MRILHKIDQLGVPFIEGGWPGANPRDTEFFKLATKETLQHAALTSFGMTRKAGERAEDSAVLRELLETGTEVVCLVGKAWDVHVTEVLRTDLDEGVAMVRDSVAFLRAQDRRVFFDAEHFFDGYRSNPAYAMDVLKAAEEAGAERSVLCDTNGGMLPADIARIVDDVVARTAKGAGRHPRAQRRRVRGGQLADRGRARRVPGAGRGERLRRTHRERRPDPDRREPRAEDGRRLPAGRSRGAAHRGGALRGRGREPGARFPPAVRGPVRVHAQGRAARERRRPPGGGLRARAAPPRSATGAASSRAIWAARPRCG